MDTLRDYQVAACDFLLANPHAMVVAPGGAGKTATTLTAMRKALNTDRATRFLVLAPKRVCTSVWPQEFVKWWQGPHTMEFSTGTPERRLAALQSKADVVVTNYDNLQWLCEQDLSSFDAVVFDELTKLKNPSGARYKALFKLVDQFKIRWGLTGTFTSNGLEDVFGQTKMISTRILGKSKTAYLNEYFYCANCDYGLWVPFPASMAKVMAKVKPATFVLENTEYVDGLPPLNKVHVPVALPNSTRLHYTEMTRHHVIENADFTVVAETAAVETQKLQQIAGGFVYTGGATHWLSTHKYERLDELLEENQFANTILVYNFDAERLELLRRYKGRAVDVRDAGAIERWNEGKIELLLVHPKSAGHGLNLQHGGRMMVFLSLPWSLDEFDQTIWRLHRGGQKQAVWVYFLLTKDTIDEYIMATLEDKRSFSVKATGELYDDVAQPD